MQVLLAHLEWGSCFVYFDDIFIASASFEQHNCHLQEVFEQLQKVGLCLKPRKCFLLREEVPYLGRVVSSSGIQSDPAKNEKVQSYPTPNPIVGAVESPVLLADGVFPTT